ncbi:MAG: M28 family metallopeptidase, partial [Candidatus Thorarchaeota archaeon]
MNRMWALSLAFVLFLGGSASAQFPVPNQVDIQEKSGNLSDTKVYGVDYSDLIHSLVDRDSYLGYVQKINENGSRWISSPTDYSSANAYARDWIISELEEVSDGRMETEIIGTYQSVVGRLPGYLGEGPAMLVGGHFDSVTVAPGANDDGSGVATAMELARVMSQFEWPLDIYFGFWNAEEIGLHGSQEVASEFTSRGIEILVYYNIDMLLVPNEHSPSDEKLLLVYPSGPTQNYHVGRLWAEIAQMMSNNVGNDMIKPVPSNEFGAWTRSDHYAFIQEGYPRSLFACESGVDNDYHTSRDTWDNPNYDYDIATELVASLGAAMAFIMSLEFGEKQSIHYSGADSSGLETEYLFAMSLANNIKVKAHSDRTANYYLYGPDGSLVDSVDD